MWRAGMVLMRLRGGAAAHQQIVGRVSELDELRRRVLAHRGYDVAPPYRLLRHASLVLRRRCTTLHHRMLLGERRAATAVVATSTALVARRRHGRGCAALIRLRLRRHLRPRHGRGCAALRRATIFHRSAIFRRSAALRRSAIRRLHRRNALHRAAILLLHVDRLACTARRAPTRGSAQLVLVVGERHAPRVHEACQRVRHLDGAEHRVLLAAHRGEEE